MKVQEIEFKKPVKIIQLFKKINIYSKAEKSFELRKERMRWHDLSSKSGYIKDEALFLPETLLQRKDFQICEMILLSDNVSNPHNEVSLSENLYFLPASFWRFDIFEINKYLDIFLRYNEYEIGLPTRNDFKLATLKPGFPVEIKINGKSDYTLSSGKERTYKDQQFILLSHGIYKRAIILREPFKEIKKLIPRERKVIDLIKPLW